MRKIIIVVFILVFSVGFVSKNTVNTEETKKTKGSIAVYLEESGNKTSNSDVALKLIKAAESIFREASTKKISGIIKHTDSSGYVKFENLENGIYLLAAEDINKYDNISPALIAVPVFDEESSETNGMKYDIVVYPKHWPVTAAKTGDNSNCELYMSGLAVIVFIPLIKKAKTGG